VTDDGFDFSAEKGVTTAVVTHGLKLGTESGTPRNPSAKGLQCGLGTTLGKVKLGKLGLAIRT
jgi:hypothetical protein